MYLRAAIFTVLAIALTLAVIFPAGVAANDAHWTAGVKTANALVREEGYFFPTHAAAIAPHATSATLDQQYTQRARSFRAVHGLEETVPVPADRLIADAAPRVRTLPVADVQAQVSRVAAARGLPPAIVAALVAQYTEYPPLGVGTAVVNLPLLNQALDAYGS